MTRATPATRTAAFATAARILNAVADNVVKDLEAAKTELTLLTAQLEKVQGERDVKVAEVTGQGNDLDTKIGALLKERSKFTGGVEPRTLAQYDRVRGARAGIGIKL